MSPRARADLWLGRIATACAGLAAALLLLIVAFVLLEALPALHDGGLSVTGTTWQPEARRFGVLALLAGSALVTAGALALAVPLGVLSATFGVLYAGPRLHLWQLRSVRLLAGLPSVVVGLWGLVHVVPAVAALRAPGASLLAGALVLAVMILPTVALTADAALRTVPRAYLQAAAALGLGRATTALRIALPSARSGIAAGVVLAAGRAVGETMAVLMVCGNVVQLPGSPFDPVRTVTANIALEMGYATAGHRAALFAGGLLLVLATTALVVLAAHLRRRPRGKT